MRMCIYIHTRTHILTVVAHLKNTEYHSRAAQKVFGELSRPNLQDDLHD